MSIFASKITPMLWFDSDAEEAAKFYTSIFPDSSIDHVARYAEAGKEHHGKEPGSAMVVSYTLGGHKFTALNGGKNPDFKFTGAISFVIDCKDQDEVDHFWEKLVEGGGKHNVCGWLSDRWGIAWQVVPSRFTELMKGPADQQKKVMGAMYKMSKFIIADLEKAAKGE